MTTPHTTLDDTGHADSSDETQNMVDTQASTVAQLDQSDGEAEVRPLRSYSSEPALQISRAIFQKIQDVVKQHNDETRTTGGSISMANPASSWANTLKEQSRLLRTKELSTLSRSEIASLRIMVQYDTRLALDLTSLRVSSLKAVDALEAVCRENERNISRLDAIAPSSLAPVQKLELVLRRNLRSTIAREIDSIMARAREVAMKGRLFG
ncbi:hypothetical protein D6D01_08679 [Aureobasidium pullulans]|uniref:Uncharacterized protein n=1 Tax=Aureobasidium pullulans TaxID=5580 RepID=A0A4S9KAF2_AURPU|nr:hypothetical protein D6D01_08679 [Aureobasidium pullulans]